MRNPAKLNLFAGTLIALGVAGTQPDALAAPPSTMTMTRNRTAAETALAQARRLRLQLKPEAALKLMDEVLTRYPKFVEGYDFRSDLRGETGDDRGALADANTMLTLCPGHADYLKKRAKLYDISGHLKKAIADYDHVLILEPTTFSVWRDRAKAHKRLKDYGSAAADFDKAIQFGKSRPEYNELLYDRAEMYLLSNNLPRALEGANVLIKEFPHMSKGLWIRARVYERESKPDLAKADRARAKVMDENFDPIEKF